MEILKADTLFWLKDAQDRIRHSAAGGRLPHSLLIHAADGLGADLLAEWIAAFALCESAGSRPCASCASCQLLISDSHPDILIVRLEEDAQQIKVDQVRALIEGLTLKSYRGGYKVGVIDGAEALNASGANAFLKTLEEPTQNTVLIMTAKPGHRLPATIASRCIRLSLRAPAGDAARAWLKGQGADVKSSWDAALALAGGAPLLALQIQASGIGDLDQEMRTSMEQLGAGSVDVTLLVERWMKASPGLRILWLENWITSRIRAGLSGRLPVGALRHKICQLYELLDSARQFRRLSTTGLNQQLALEALLIGGLAALRQ